YADLVAQCTPHFFFTATATTDIYSLSLHDALPIFGQRAKILFLFIILILVLMVNAVFAWVISNLFITFPSSVFPVFIQIPLAVWIGFAVYKRQKKMLVPSLIALFIMYAAAIFASKYEFLQIDLVRYMGGEDGTGLFGLSTVGTA